MEIKKIMLAAILLISCISAMPIAIGQVSTGVNIQISLINQDPDPIEPGKYVDVRFKLENLGSQNAEDFKVEIMPKYPFYLEPGDNAIQDAGSIQGRQTGDVGAIVKYRLRVDKNAVEGENKISLRYKYGNYGWIEVPDFSINIRPIEAMLSINSVSSTPEIIKPGEIADIKFSLKNMEDIIIKDIKVKLGLSGLSFAPIGSSTEKAVYSLDPKTESSIEFKLMADPSAESGLVKVPITVLYKDQLSKNYSISSDIGLIIGAKPELSIFLDSSTITQSGTRGEVTVKFVNKGVSKVKFVSVKLKQTSDFDFGGSSEIYIGNIDSDDYDTAQFKIFVKKTDKTEIALPITIEYKDTNNKQYSEDVQLKLKLYTTAQAKELGYSNGNSKVGIVLTIAIVIVGLTVYIIWRKKRKKE